MPGAATRSRFLFLSGGILAIVVGLLLLLQHSSGRLAGTRALVESTKLESAGGSAYVGSIPIKLRQSDIPPGWAISENGKALTPSPSSNQVRGGPGLFSVSLKQVWLSATDGSDPRQNGRAYEMYVPRAVSKAGLAVAWLLVISGIALLVRGFCGVWFWIIWKKPGAPQAAQPKLNREWSLDMIRGIAILLVFFAHVGPPSGLPDAALRVLHHLNIGGWTGVDLFFVLSRYLITGLLLKEWQQTGSVEVGRFLYRRAWKIYPTHWVLILATLVASTFLPLPNAQITVDRVTHEFLYIQNYLGGVWGHTWSLGVEEQFYLVLAFLFATFTPRTGDAKGGGAPAWLPRLAVCLCVLCPVLRTVRSLHDESGYTTNVLSPHLRADALMWGVLLRYFRHLHPDAFAQWARRLRWWGIPAAVLLMSPSFAFGIQAWTTTFNLTAVSLATCVLILCLFGWQQSRDAGRALAPWCFLGRHSYTLYLWHVPVAHFFTRYYLRETDAPTSMAWFAVCVVTMFALALGSSWLIEAPLLRLRDRLVPSGAREKENGISRA